MSNPIRPLTRHEREALRDSIEAHGRILVPVLVDQHGEIIDGHHRKAIADELGIECPVDQIEVADDTERLAMAIEANAARRQLGLHERADLHKRLREAGWSYRRIAETTGVHHSTVEADVKSTVGNPTVQPDRIVGADGKSRPATRPKPPISSFDPGPSEPADPIPDWVDDAPDVKRHALRTSIHSMMSASFKVVADIAPDDAAALFDPPERASEEASVSRLIDWLTSYRGALRRSGLTIMKGGRG